MIENNIKLIASDIDGTLVPDGCYNIDEEIFEVILELKKRGIYFVAASGRQYPSIEKLFAPIKDDIFFITENGGYITCRDRELFSNPMDKNLVAELIKDVRKLDGCDILAGGKIVEYVESKNEKYIDWLVNGYRSEIIRVDDILDVSEDIVKVSVYREQEIEKYTVTLKEKWQDRLKVTLAGDCWLDFMRVDVNKGYALKLIQDSLKIKPEETMVFGDQLNDIEMLQSAKYSYAVANAREEAKAVANYLCDSNINNGVLKTLKQLL